MDWSWGSGRRAGWVVAGTALLLTATVFGADLVIEDQAASYMFGQVVFTVVVLAAAVLAGYVALRTDGREARVWLLISVACGAIFCSQAYWTGSIVTRGTWPEPISLSNVFDTLAVAVFGLLLLTLMRLPEGSLGPWRLSVDIVGLGWTVFMLLYAYVVTPWFASVEGATQAAAILGAAYPVFGLTVVVGTIARLVGPKVRMWRRWEHLIAWSIILLAAGLVLWPAWYIAMLERTPLVPEAIETLWASGLFLAFSAALFRLDSTERWAVGPLNTVEASGVTVSRFVVPLVFAGSAMLFGFEALAGTRAPLPTSTLGTAAAVLGLIFVVRTLLAAMETRELMREARTDVLTGVGDRRSFSEAMAGFMGAAERYAQPLAVAMLDIDRMAWFRSVYGVAEAENLVREVAARAQATCPPKGRVFRVGTDGFTIVFPGMTPAETSHALGAMRATIAEDRVSRGTPVTISAGVAAYPFDAQDGEQLVEHAEAALRWGKANGRDRVVLYSATVDAAERVSHTGRGARARSVECLGTVALAHEARYPGFVDHSRRVANLAVLLGSELGLEPGRLEALEQAALLHDIGMLAVPDTTLLQAGPLVPRQWEAVYEHPVLGERIISAAHLSEVGRIVRWHHERWDGSGYPDGLAGAEASLEARVLAVCEAFDAMTSVRPHRAAMSVEASLQQIDLGIGTQFDPTVAELFIRMVSRDDLLGPGPRLEFRDAGSRPGADRR